MRTSKSATAILALMVFGTAASTALHLPRLPANKTNRQVSSLSIPIKSSPYYTGTVGVSDGHIIVGDKTGGTGCRLAVVDPKSLKLVSNKSISCSNPELSGENVLPIDSVPHPDLQTGVVRISTYDTRTGKVHVGPVVLQYGNFSDSRPEWTYGDHSLWIFDAEGFTTGTFKNGRAVLLRVSLSTGAVLRRYVLPNMDRILLAADDNGLWFARSNVSSWSNRISEPSSLYFIGNGSKHPVVVSNKGVFVGWLTASGHTARAFFVSSGTANTGEVDSFNSPRAKPTILRLPKSAATASIPRDIGEEDFDSRPVLTFGNELVFATPLYHSSNSAQVSAQQVFIFNPATGREMKIATIPTYPYEYFQPNIVYNGALYLLEGAEQAVNSVTLYRVKL